MSIKPQYRFPEGEILLINKPLDWTSFDAVNKVRGTIKHLLGVKKIKVGHAGTLDPKADGLLIICTGKFTKRIEEFQDMEKEYTGTLMLGSTTPSFDTETEPEGNAPTDHVTKELLLKTTQQFLGELEQTPPVFSAKKIDGKPAYLSARKGAEVKLKKAFIVVHEFEITSIQLPQVHFRIRCSKGTYIRSIAHDFGAALGTGAYLSALRRTQIGPYKLSDATPVTEWVTHVKLLVPKQANMA